LNNCDFMKKTFFIFFIFFILTFFVACDLVEELSDPNIEVPVKESEQKNFNIAVLVPLDEETIYLGQEVIDGVELALSQIKKENILKDTKIMMIYENSGCSYEVTKRKTQEILKNYKVDAIITGFCSEETLAIQDLTLNMNIPILALFSESNKVDKRKNDTYRLSSNNKRQIEETVKFVKNDLKEKNIFLINQNNAYGKELIELFVLEFGKSDGIIFGSASFESGTTDFEKLIQNFNLNPSQSIYLAALSSESKKLLEQLNKTDTIATIIASDALDDVSIKELEFKENINLFIAKIKENNDESWEDFAVKFYIEYDKEPSLGASEGFDAMNIIIKAIINSSTDLNNFIKDIKYYFGASGEITFDKYKDNISKSWVFLEIP